jgi:transcriptional regulator with XRE-family HTH domain
MSKRKPMDKAQTRERRNRLLESAATAKLSLTEGVREMRAIAGMTQEEFAEHRRVSPRVIKAIELGQGNPTVATLNKIGEFFGLEVGFVPASRSASAMSSPEKADAEELPASVFTKNHGVKHLEVLGQSFTPALEEAFKEHLQKALERELLSALSAPDIQRQLVEYLKSALGTTDEPVEVPSIEQVPATGASPVRQKKKSSPS